MGLFKGKFFRSVGSAAKKVVSVLPLHPAKNPVSKGVASGIIGQKAADFADKVGKFEQELFKFGGIGTVPVGTIPPEPETKPMNFSGGASSKGETQKKSNVIFIAVGAIAGLFLLSKILK